MRHHVLMAFFSHAFRHVRIIQQGGDGFRDLLSGSWIHMNSSDLIDDGFYNILIREAAVVVNGRPVYLPLALRR